MGEVLKSVYARLIFVAVFNFGSICAGAQFFEKEIPANLKEYQYVGYPSSELIQRNKVKTMHYCIVPEKNTTSFLNDTNFVIVPSSENELYLLRFNAAGQLIEKTNNSLSINVYKYTYDQKGNCVSSENYRDGKSTWQSKMFMKWDINGNILQRKTIWKDYYTGKMDQVSYFDCTWKNNYKTLEISNKITFERGKATKGNVTSKWFFSCDAYGYDTSLTEERFNENTHKWDIVYERSKWERDSTGRIIGKKRWTEKENQDYHWTYDVNGRLVCYETGGFYFGLNQGCKREYFYDKKSMLRGMRESGKGRKEIVLAIVYEYY
ncbi:MAG TPA: hypothetical protein VK177_04960 [Flavobacteriales bacterium]|nr:hypothetical protein [Flavobacteriales bacterium]